jgi:hypothetical protein
MPSPRASSVLRFVTERLTLDVQELVEIRDGIDEFLRERLGAAPPTKRRTLYLPTDSLDDL